MTSNRTTASNRTARNNSRSTSTRTGRRIAATAALTLAGLGLGAGIASAAPQFQNDGLDIVDAPACSPWDVNWLHFVAVPWFNNQTAVRVGYNDGVDTCAAPIELWSYRLPGPDAGIDHPDTVLDMHQIYDINKVETDTVNQGGPYNWRTVSAFECWAFRLSVGGTVVSTMTLAGDCGPLEPVIVLPDPVDPEPENPGDLKDVDPVDPEPEPEHPGDVKLPDPVDPDPEHPGDVKLPDPVDPEPEHPGDVKLPDPVDPEPEHPGDFTLPDPVDPQPDQPNQPDESDDSPEIAVDVPADGNQGGEGTSEPGEVSSFGPASPSADRDLVETGESVESLPTTGASTGVLALLASILVGLGGAGMHVARREVI